MTEQKRYKILALETTGYHLIENRAYDLTREQCDILINEYVNTGQNPTSIKAVLVDDPRYVDEKPGDTGYIPQD
tara:strand:+ start:314 stop:535 length:222 start_codon:yes stop_codon:yes gene_type:complete